MCAAFGVDTEIEVVEGCWVEVEVEEGRSVMKAEWDQHLAGPVGVTCKVVRDGAHFERQNAAL
jgi:hypothetical protein